MANKNLTTYLVIALIFAMLVSVFLFAAFNPETENEENDHGENAETSGELTNSYENTGTETVESTRGG